MSNKTVENQLIQLNQLYKESEDIYHSFAVYFGLSDSTLWLLYSLYEAEESCTQAEISSMWFMSKQTLNSALKNLEASGYIQLRPSVKNRNAKQITLTSHGKVLIQETVGRMIVAEKQALSRLDAEERDTLLRFSRRHLEYFKEEMKQVVENKKLGEEI